MNFHEIKYYWNIGLGVRVVVLNATYNGEGNRSSGSGVQTHNTVIGTDCIGSYKSNYDMITTTTAPFPLKFFFYSCIIRFDVEI